MVARKRILAVVVGVAALALALAWRVDWRRESARALRLDAGSDTATTTSVELADPESNARSPFEPASVSGTSEVATGVLVVRVESEAGGAPLAGIELCVGRERGGDQHLASASTDEHGEARFDDIEANTLIVEARRSPPFARAFAAAWLEPGEVETVVVRMTAGTSVRGRVIDDLGLPVDGAEILASSDLRARFAGSEHALLSQRVAATSDSNGRFEVRHLSPEPGDVWIERGAMAPRRWTWPKLVARRGDALRDVAPSFVEGEDVDVDVGDVVLPRAATFRGVVVDARGDPVAGALLSTLVHCGTDVSVRCEHWPGRPEDEPSAEGFRVLAGETKSERDGTFALVARGDAGQLEVRTLDGARHELRLPASAPGTVLDGLRFVLADARVLRLDLVDANGARVSSSRRGAYPFQPEAKLRLARGDFADRLVPERDGTFRIQTDAVDGEPRVLHLRLGGYATVEHEFAPEPATELRITLVESPTLRLRVRFEDAPRGEEVEKDLYWLHAVAATSNDPNEGLFGREDVAASRDPRDLAIVLDVDAPHFVVVKRHGDSWTRTYGPFAASAHVHEIVIPRLEPLARRSAEPEHACVRLDVRDAVTDERLEPEIEVEGPLGSANWFASASWTPRGPPFKSVPSGARRIRVSARDYVPSEPLDIDFAPGSEHDLGSFRLVPLAEHQVVVVAPGNAALARSVWLHLWADSGGQKLSISPVRALEGRAVVRGEVAAAASVHVSEIDENASTGERAQTAEVEQRADGTLEVRLVPWVRVEVRVATASEAERTARIDVLASSRGSTTHGFRELAPLEGVRRFTGWVPEGAARVHAEGPLLAKLEASVDLRADAEQPVVVELAR